MDSKRFLWLSLKAFFVETKEDWTDFFFKVISACKQLLKYIKLEKIFLVIKLNWLLTFASTWCCKFCVGITHYKKIPIKNKLKLTRTRKDLRRSVVQLPCLNSDWFAQEFVLLFPEILQRYKVHNLSRQPMPMVSHPQNA